MAKYKYLDLQGLETFATKINDKFTASVVTVTSNLNSGTKIATITVGEQSTDLYCEKNTDTTYTFVPGDDGSFTVTPSDGSASQKVSIGKPATTRTADSALSAEKLSVTDVGSDITPVKFENGVPVAVTQKLATAKSVSDLQTLVNNLAGADFLEYKGTLEDEDDLPTQQVKNGYVYIVNGSWTGTYGTVEPGDLLIANGNENEDGFITGTINWNVVQTNIHNAVSGNNLTSDYLVLGNDERNVKISGIKVIQQDNKYYLDGFDETISAQLSQDSEATSGNVAFLISVEQTDARLSGGTCATMARITDEEINNLW